MTSEFLSLSPLSLAPRILVYLYQWALMLRRNPTCTAKNEHRYHGIGVRHLHPK